MQITSSTNPYLGATQTNETVQVKSAEQQTVQVQQQSSTSSDTVTISAEAAEKLSDEQLMQTLGSGWGNEPPQ